MVSLTIWDSIFNYNLSPNSDISQVESTTSGRRVRKRNLDECDSTPTGSNRTKKSKNSRKLSKRKSSKAKTLRPQRIAARNARSMLSQMDEISTDGEDVDLEDDSSDSLQDSDILSEPERKTHSKCEELKQPFLDGLANAAKPPPHSESQSDVGNRRRLVLKFSLRDSKKNVPLEDMRLACDTQADMLCQSSKSQESIREPLPDRSSMDPALSSTDVSNALPQSHSRSEDNDKMQSENAINYLDGSICVEGNTVQCKEVKIDTSKSSRSGFDNHLEQNANGYVKFWINEKIILVLIFFFFWVFSFPSQN